MNRSKLLRSQTSTSHKANSQVQMQGDSGTWHQTLLTIMPMKKKLSVLYRRSSIVLSNSTNRLRDSPTAPRNPAHTCMNDGLLL